MRKQPVGPLNFRDFTLEAGDRVYSQWNAVNGKAMFVMYDLRESRGRFKSAAGELTPVLVRKNGKPRFAYKKDGGRWVWRRDS